MSNRVRLMCQINNYTYYASGVIAHLEVEATNNLKSLPKGIKPRWKYAIELFKLLPVRKGFALWIFREPRGVKEDQSRYKQLCGYWGIGRGKRTRPVEQPAPVFRLRRAGQVDNAGAGVVGPAPPRPIWAQGIPEQIPQPPRENPFLAAEQQLRQAQREIIDNWVNIARNIEPADNDPF